MKPKALAVLFIILCGLLAMQPTVRAETPQQPVWGVPADRYRTGVILSNPSNTSETEVPAVFYLQVPWGEMVDAYNELVVTNSTQQLLNSTVLWQSEDDGFVVGVCVLANVTLGPGATQTFYAYYGDPSAPPVTHSPTVGSSASTAVFSGFDMNYTFLSTFTIDLVSYLTIPSLPREGSTSLGAATFDSLVQPWRVVPFPSTAGSILVASTIGNDSGLIDVRTLVGTNSSFWLSDFLINQGGGALAGTSEVYYYDLSHLGTAVGSQASYSPSNGTLSVTAGEARLQMLTPEAPAIVDLGATTGVLGQALSGDLSSSDGASGKVGLGVEYHIPQLQPFGYKEIQTEWDLANSGQPQISFPTLVGFSGQESIDSSIPGLFANYDASISLNQATVNSVLGPGSNFTYGIAPPSTVVPNSIGFSGDLNYSLPDAGEANFTSSSGWTSTSVSTSTSSSVASSRYYSPVEKAYTGIVSVSGVNSSFAGSNSKSGSATLVSVPLQVYGVSTAILHLTYLASSTVASPTNQTSLYFAVEIENLSNGVVSSKLVFPVDGLAPQATGESVIQNLHGDGTWHQITVSLNQYIPQHGFTALLVLNATATTGDTGSLALQATDSYLEASSPGSSVLGISVHTGNAGGTIQFSTSTPDMTILSPVDLEVPIWESAPLATTDGDQFNATLQVPSFSSSVGRAALEDSISSVRVAVFGPNTTLTAAYVNGDSVTPTPTPGGIILSQLGSGALNIGLDYVGVPYSLQVLDVNNGPVATSIEVFDSFGNLLINSTSSAQGLALNLVPGEYIATATFQGTIVANQTIEVVGPGSSSLRASVYVVGVYVSNILGEPIPHASVELNSISSSYSTTGVTGPSGKASFELVANLPYDATASFSGNIIGTERIMANTDGEVISIPTGYTPTWIPVLLVVLLVSIFVLAVYIPKIAARQKTRHAAQVNGRLPRG
jgi:hypothetical protein